MQGTIKRVRVTWMRWDSRRLRNVTSHPWQYIYTDPDGGEHVFNTKREAADYAAEIWGDK